MLGKTKWRLGQNRKAFEYLDENLKTSKLGEYIHAFLIKNEPLVKDEVIVEELSLNPEVANIVYKTPVIKEAQPEIAKKPVIKKPKVKKVPKRRKALNFSAESQNGGDISLNLVKKNAKVTLVDFWASWCGPCRKSNPHLKQLYNKYHSKGFNIIGVSEDKLTDKSSWLNAIAVDALPWQQVIDDYGRIAEIYNVSGIPHTVLIDSKGGIIFQKKSTYTIEKKLKEIFGFKFFSTRQNTNVI
jgi:thiol-disulfide isomerase/thioredoxin